MIKECKVTLRNPKVSVIDVDGTIVQIPTSELVGENVAYIKCDGGKYIAVSRNEYEAETEIAKSKQTKKKVVETKVETKVETEIKSNAETIVMDNVDDTVGV